MERRAAERRAFSLSWSSRVAVAAAVVAAFPTGGRRNIS
jgi:hypothetical protein